MSVATHQFVHEIWVGAGGEQLSAGQGLVDKRIVLKGIPKGRLHPTDTGLEGERRTPLSRLTPKFKCYLFFFFFMHDIVDAPQPVITHTTHIITNSAQEVT